MKAIKIRTCGVCPYNSAIHKETSTYPFDFRDHCDLIDKPVNPNVIHEDCILEDLEENE